MLVKRGRSQASFIRLSFTRGACTSTVPAPSVTLRVSPLPLRTIEARPFSCYEARFLSRTSAATPFAAGTAALVLQAAGGWNALDRSQMLAVLQANGDGVTDGRTGRLTPRVNAAASVNAVRVALEGSTDGWFDVHQHRLQR